MAVLTAVSNPNVEIVPSTSLSMVFGTPTMRMPLSHSCCAMASDPSPPIEMIAFDAASPRVGDQLVGPIHLLDRAVGPCAVVVKGIAAIRGAEDRATQVADASDRVARQRDDIVITQEASVPFRIPHTSQPRSIDASTAARMTAFSPGAYPPPVDSAMRIGRR